MRFKRHLRLGKGLSSIGIVPLIDVVFLLLIFFMLNSSFIVFSASRLAFPKVVTGQTGRFLSADIVIMLDGSIYLNGSSIKLSDLAAYLKEIALRKGAVLIKAEHGLLFSKVIKIWDLCRDNGIVEINIAADQE